MLTSFIFVPVAGLEPARLGSSIELHGMLLTSTLVAVFCFGARALPRGTRTVSLVSVGTFPIVYSPQTLEHLSYYSKPIKRVTAAI